jgi:hypothetical protein
MGGLTVESNCVAFDAKCSEHGPERLIQIEKNWTLFDVQLEISCGVRELLATILHLLKINSIRFKRRGQRDALLVFQTSRFIQLQVTGARR